MSIHKENPGRGGDRDTSKALSRIKPTSHMGRVLAALRQRPMSNIELMSELNIAHPPAAVRDLRRAGIRIDTREYPHPSRPGEKIKRYHVVSDG